MGDFNLEEYKTRIHEFNIDNAIKYLQNSIIDDEKYAVLGIIEDMDTIKNISKRKKLFLAYLNEAVKHEEVVCIYQGCMGFIKSDVVRCFIHYKENGKIKEYMMEFDWSGNVHTYEKNDFHSNFYNKCKIHINRIERRFTDEPYDIYGYKVQLISERFKLPYKNKLPVELQDKLKTRVQWFNLGYYIKKDAKEFKMHPNKKYERVCIYYHENDVFKY